MRRPWLLGPQWGNRLKRLEGARLQVMEVAAFPAIGKGLTFPAFKAIRRGRAACGEANVLSNPGKTAGESKQ